MYLHTTKINDKPTENTYKKSASSFEIIVVALTTNIYLHGYVCMPVELLIVLVYAKITSATTTTTTTTITITN